MSLYPAQPRAIPTPPPVECEICGMFVADQDKFSYVIVAANTGHPNPAFQCPALQHFGCSPEHALEAAIQCLQNHYHPLVMAMITSK